MLEIICKCCEMFLISMTAIIFVLLMIVTFWRDKK